MIGFISKLTFYLVVATGEAPLAPEDVTTVGVTKDEEPTLGEDALLELSLFPQASKSSEKSSMEPSVKAHELPIGKAIKQIQQMAEELEFEMVIELSAKLILRRELPPKDRIAVLYLQARAFVSLDDQLSAEGAFRLLIRSLPGFDITDDESPAIVAIFRKVQAEEEKMRQNLWLLEFQNIMSEMALDGGPTGMALGGLPVDFTYRLHDPRQSVDRFELSYRKDPSTPFATLPFSLTKESWFAQIPAEWTENSDGLTLQYYATTYHMNGAVLAKQGQPGSPFSLELEPGAMDDHINILDNPWVWVGAATGLVATVATAALVIYFESKVPEAPGGLLD
jgi:hypothetical protein